MTIKHFLRKTAECFLLTFGGRYGKKVVRSIDHYCEPSIHATAWKEFPDSDKDKVIDQNIPLIDHYCPICDADSEFDAIADQVMIFMKVPSRKVFYQCRNCQFLFTNESRINREEYFQETQYKKRIHNIRLQREIDLAELGLRMIHGGKDSNILIYAAGKNSTIKEMASQGYTNVWGSDITDDIEYGVRTINVAKEPDYFENNNIKFDVIIACEVWEHYSRLDINPAFEWLLKQSAEGGIVIGTTGLWHATKKDDPVYNASTEYGLGHLSWWFYAHPADHTSFYRADNLRTIGHRNGKYAGFGYFSDSRVHREEPSKKVIAFVSENNIDGISNLKRHFNFKHHDILYY